MILLLPFFLGLGLSVAGLAIAVHIGPSWGAWFFGPGVGILGWTMKVMFTRSRSRAKEDRYREQEPGEEQLQPRAKVCRDALFGPLFIKPGRLAAIFRFANESPDVACTIEEIVLRIPGFPPYNSYEEEDNPIVPRDYRNEPELTLPLRLEPGAAARGWRYFNMDEDSVPEGNMPAELRFKATNAEVEPLMVTIPRKL